METKGLALSASFEYLCFESPDIIFFYSVRAGINLGRQILTTSEVDPRTEKVNRQLQIYLYIYIFWLAYYTTALPFKHVKDKT